ncbi:MAG TPA: hypothetical protein VF076_05935 [Acidimicrobiales bacterium]
MGSYEIGQQLAAAGAAYQNQVADFGKQEQSLDARYGTSTPGALDFIDPKDPFSVTGAAKRLFREQQGQQYYGAFAGGYGLDGSANAQMAKLGIDQSQKQRDITDEYLGSRNAIGSARVQAAGGWGQTSSSLNAELANAFASEQSATLGGDPAAAAPTAAASTPGGAAAARAGGQTKRARGFLWRLNSDGKTWTKVRPLNGFGQ